MGGAIVIPPGEGVRYGNVEFLGLSEHSPRLNVSVITMRPNADGPESHVHADEDDVFYVLDGELTFLLDEGDVAAPGRHVRAGAAGREAHLPERARPAHSRAQHPHPGRLRPPAYGRRLTRVQPVGLSPSSGGPPSRRGRERRAYQLVLAGSAAGTVAVVGFVLALVGVLGWGIPVLAAIVAAICAWLFRRTVG